MSAPLRRSCAPSPQPPPHVQQAKMPMYFVAIANHIPAKTGHPDLTGVTINPNVVDSCPAAWQHVQDDFTRTQVGSVIQRVDEKREETGGWNAEKGASQNLLDAIHFVESHAG